MEYKKTYYTHGVPSKLILESPEEIRAEKKYPLIILCHGFGCHKNDGLDQLSHILAAEGFMTMRFDFRGCGETTVNKYQLYCASQWPYDLIHVINYAHSLGCIDMDRIGVAGISMGACTAVYTAGIDKRIRAVAAMSGIGDCEEWLRYVWKSQGGDFDAFTADVYKDAGITAATGAVHMRNLLEMFHFPQKDLAEKLLFPFIDPDASEYVAWDCLQELLLYKPVRQCPHIEQPIFFLTGGDDLLVPQEQSRMMYEAVKSDQKKLKNYPGIDHNMPADPNRAIAFADITEWFKEHV